MLSLDKLAALDLSVWLRSGQEAADRLAITQPNVNRRVHHCLALLGLNLAKHDDEWEVEGPAFGLELLALERRVHQTARWMGRAPLRVEGTYWSGPLLLNPSPAGWVVGRCNVVGIGRPLQWLREGMIDGWLAGGPDWPEPQDPEFAVIELCHMPVHAVVAPGHPLLHQLERGQKLSWDDVAAFPSLALPPGTYPKVEASLKELGLWSSPARMARYRRSRWEGKTEQQLMVGYATVLSEQVAGGLVRLPLQLPLASGEALVVVRQWAGHPRIKALAELLRERLAPWGASHPELVLCP
ncbi:MAG: LysR substrate-binding domain-containing protein [Cyanobacteriota bacterium]|jgi:LysR substrate binding domain|nr:LysR substrate-binding domain-containing protein [Cyanobacteriota bacterium]